MNSSKGGPDIQWEHNLAGSLQICTGVFTLAFYIMCIKILATDKEMKDKACNKIMVQLGIADCIVVLVYGPIAGIYSITQASENWLMKFFAGLQNATWMSLSVFADLLAFNRFVLIVFPVQSKTVFCKRNTIIFLVLGWLYGCCYMATYMTPVGYLVYIPDSYIWHYSQGWLANIVSEIEMRQNFTQCGMMAFWYLCIIIKLRLTKGDSAETNEGRSNVEIRILIQTGIICSVMASAIFVWFTIPYWFPGNKWAIFACSLYVLINSGINPFIYLVFNTQLRMKFKEMIGMKSNQVVGLQNGAGVTKY